MTCYNRVIAHLDLETGNGSRVQKVEEQYHHWSPVDLSFTGVNTGQNDPCYLRRSQVHYNEVGYDLWFLFRTINSLVVMHCRQREN